MPTLCRSYLQSLFGFSEENLLKASTLDLDKLGITQIEPNTFNGLKNLKSNPGIVSFFKNSSCLSEGYDSF